MNVTLFRPTDRPLTFDEHAATAMLIVAHGQTSDANRRAERAEQHADDAQEFLDAVLTHPSSRARLSVIEGGAHA